MRVPGIPLCFVLVLGGLMIPGLFAGFVWMSEDPVGRSFEQIQEGMPLTEVKAILESRQIPYRITVPWG